MKNDYALNKMQYQIKTRIFNSHSIYKYMQHNIGTDLKAMKYRFRNISGMNFKCFLVVVN